MESYASLVELYSEHPLGGGDGELLHEILNLLYTPEEAGFLAAVGFDPQTAEEMPEAAGGMLRGILQKRGIYFIKEGGTVRYCPYEPFPGLMMFPLIYAVKAGGPERAASLRSLLEGYLRSRFPKTDGKGRIVPVRAVAWSGVLPAGRGEIPAHFKAERLIESAKDIAGAACPYINIEASPTGRLFDDSRVKGGTTFLFNDAARFAKDAGIAASVKGGDLVDAVEKGAVEGVVLITSRFAEGVEFLCCAGADSCIFLKGVRESVFDGSTINSGFAVRVKAGECTGCGTCKEVCPVGAIRIGNVARIDDGKCIGCGHCVTICPQKAMMLIKDRGVQVRLPRNKGELMRRAQK